MINPQDFLHPEDEVVCQKYCHTENYNRLRGNIRLLDSGKKCNHCRQPVDASWKFCKFCGSKIE